MSRPSFGGDLFSPEVSDSPFNAGGDRNSGRGSISEILRKNSPLVSTQSNDLKKESNTLEIKRRNLFPSDNIQVPRTASSYNEIQRKVVKTSNKKVIKSESEVTSILPVTKRDRSKRSNNSLETDKVSKHASNKSSSSKASKNPVIQSKFITVRGSNSKREEPTITPNIIINGIESIEEKENKGDSKNSSAQDSVFESSGDNKTLIEVSTKLDLQSTKKLIADPLPSAVYKLEEKPQVPPTSTDEACQIQGQILEKLINDTVSDKFHAVRMQLHSMHFSLLKAFGERMDEMEKRNEDLFKIIGDLLEENRQLRNMVLMQR